MPSDSAIFRFSDPHGNELDGRLEKPANGPVRAIALFAHCFTCSKNSLAAKRIASGLAARGIAVLRFDFTGLGESEGEFCDSGFVANVADLIAATDALRDREAAPALLIGHSLGGAAAIAAALKIPEIRAVVTIGAPYDVGHVLGRLGESLAAVEQAGEGEVDIGGRPFRVNRAFLDQMRDQPQASRIEALDRALMVMHDPGDETVGIENARRIFETARHPKSFVSLDGAGHLLLRKGDGDYAAGVIAAWVEAHLDG